MWEFTLNVPQVFGEWFLKIQDPRIPVFCESVSGSACSMEVPGSVKNLAVW